MNEGTVKKALNLCYFYLKFRDRTEWEIREYLRRKSGKYGFNEEIIEESVSKLKEEGLIDDDKFVKSYVRAKLNNANKSFAYIRAKLLKLGISKQLLDGLNESDDAKEADAAYRALSVRWDRWSTMEAAPRRRRAYQFLMRRGFSYTITKQAVAMCQEDS